MDKFYVIPLDTIPTISTSSSLTSSTPGQSESDLHHELDIISRYEHHSRHHFAKQEQRRCCQWIPLRTITEHFSATTAYFFLYSQSNIYLYVVWSLLALLFAVPQWKINTICSQTPFSWLSCINSLFLVSHASATQFGWWFTSIFLSFCGYWIYIALYFRVGQQRGFKSWDPLQDRYDNHVNAINAARVPHWLPSPLIGKVVSATFFLLLLVTYTFVQYKLQELLLFSKQIWLLLFGGVFHTLFKNVWRLCCWSLTFCEGHTSFTPICKSHFFKVYLFDLVTFLVFYASHWLLKTKSNALGVCETDWIAQQYVMILSMDYVYGLLELGWVWLRNNCKTKQGKILFPAPLDIAEEYARVMFRQYLTFSGLFLVNGISFLSLLLSILEYNRVQYKLIYLSPKSQERANSNFLTLLVVTTVFNIVVTLLAYPGWIWYFLYPQVLNTHCDGIEENIFDHLHGFTPF
jgi:hypothetical protein